MFQLKKYFIIRKTTKSYFKWRENKSTDVFDHELWSIIYQPMRIDFGYWVLTIHKIKTFNYTISQWTYAMCQNHIVKIKKFEFLKFYCSFQEFNKAFFSKGGEVDGSRLRGFTHNHCIIINYRLLSPSPMKFLKLFKQFEILLFFFNFFFFYSQNHRILSVKR